MALVSKTLSGFWNGISQQAPTARRENQCTDQVNVLGTLVDGLYKRPNTEHLALLASNVSSGCFVHRINRDLDDRYIVIFTADAAAPIEVYKVDGTKCTVDYGTIDSAGAFTADASKKAYAVSTDPFNDFKAVTVADYTFVVNKSKTVAMTADVSAGTITDTVQSYADLPQAPGEGAIYEVAGDMNSDFDNFYMAFTGGVWRETIRPGIKYKLDDSTMPHRLVQTGADTFAFAPCIWGERTVGDEQSILTPTFVGKTISNTFFYKNRLGFLSHDNCLMSRAGGYFDFFGRSALDIHDDDPIDTSATAKEIQILRSVAVFDKSLMLLADQQQFDLSSDGGPLSPKTVTITPTTAFPIDINHEPVTAGANVYFVSPRDKYVSVREYFIQPDSLTNDAADVTAHVPKYIPSGSPLLETVNAMDLMFMHSSGAPDTLYVYKYFWSGDEKPQSAWCKWTFDGEIMGFKAIDSTLYLVMSRNSGTEISLEKIALENVETDSLEFRVHLDRMVRLQGTYTAGTDTTEWTLPYADSAGEFLIIDPDTGFPLTSVNKPDAYTLNTGGDFSAKTYLIGRKYSGSFELSEWFMRNSQNVAITEGRLQVRSLTLSFTKTGAFKVLVDSPGRTTLTHSFSGVQVGVSHIGAAALLDGTKRFLVMSNSKNLQIRVVNDDYLPTAFQSGMFEGWFQSRSRIL